MKAKEWAPKFAADAADAGNAFVIETMKLLLTRNNNRDVFSDSVIEGVLSEQHQKFRAIADRVPGLDPNDFYDLMENKVPDVWRRYVIAYDKKCKRFELHKAAMEGKQLMAQAKATKEPDIRYALRVAAYLAMSEAKQP